MALEKATITNVDTSESFQVLFNPTEYVLKKETPWAEQKVYHRYAYGIGDGTILRYLRG